MNQTEQPSLSLLPCTYDSKFWAFNPFVLAVLENNLLVQQNSLIFYLLFAGGIL